MLRFSLDSRRGSFHLKVECTFASDWTVIFGPSGAGKSTLIRMMTTLMPVTSGTAIVGGHDVVKDSDAVRRMIGVIPQALTSDPDLTVG